MMHDERAKSRLPELEDIKVYKTKSIFRERICQHIGPGDWLEFGVMAGESAFKFLKYGVKDGAKLYLFDNWEGLPEDWTGHSSKRTGPILKGAMKTPMPHFSDKRAVVVKGWFDESLPKWSQEYKGKVAFVHIDCDLYSSTKTIFQYIWPFIGKGTFIAFDELCGYPAFRDHEYKAFMEFVAEHNVQFRYVVRTPKMAQVMIEITEDLGVLRQTSETNP